MNLAFVPLFTLFLFLIVVFDAFISGAWTRITFAVHDESTPFSFIHHRQLPHLNNNNYWNTNESQNERQNNGMKTNKLTKTNELHPNQNHLHFDWFILFLPLNAGCFTRCDCVWSCISIWFCGFPDYCFLFVLNSQWLLFSRGPHPSNSPFSLR